MAAAARPMILADVLWPAEGPRKALRTALLLLSGVLFVALLAQLKFYLPDNPVPFTMQPLAVLLIGAAYGGRLGAATLGLYLLAGAAGLPFFADGKSGLAVLSGATGGYIVGFVLAAGLV